VWPGLKEPAVPADKCVNGQSPGDRLGRRAMNGYRGSILAAMMALLAWAAGPALADPTFDLVNAGPVTIERVFVSPSSDDNWGRDVLGASVIRPGAAQRIRPFARQECVFDIRVVYQGGQSEVRRRQNLCQVTQLVFRGGGGAVPGGSATPGGGALPGGTSTPGGSAQPSTGNPSFALVNRSPRTIQRLFASPSRDRNWGTDRLGAQVLAAGQRFQVTLPAGDCEWDVAVVYDDGQREERRRQPLCSLSELVFTGAAAAPPSEGAGPGTGTGTSFGTGFFVTREGHLLTNAHVVQGCSRTTVVHEGGQVSAQILRRDERNDLALLRIEAPRGVAFARFRAAPSIRAGDGVVVSGFPLPSVLQNGLNITTGNVSAMSGIGGNIALMQITAPVQPGNSGGPLLDLAGHVVGVVVSKLNAQRVFQQTGDLPQNINFAVQGAVARLFLDAAGVRYQEASSETERKAADVGDLSRAFTVQILCQR